MIGEGGASHLQEYLNYNLSVVDKKAGGRCKMIYLSHKKGVVYMEKNGFFRKIMLIYKLHQ